MLHLRKITGSRRNYLVALPAESCRRQHLRPGDAITLQVRVGDHSRRFPARVLAHGRGLSVTIPHPWRLSEGLSAGDPVVLLEGEPGLFELQIVKGATEKELHRRGEVLMRLRIAKVRQESQRREDAKYHEGHWRGRFEVLGIHIQNAYCFNPAHAQHHARE